MNSSNHFIIAGAQRSGTTMLYHLLDHHPAITMSKPVKPEPKFFLNHGGWTQGYDYYREKYFKEAATVQWYGEKTTSYMEYESVPIRIKQVLPDASIIFILRNPVFRAISNYYFSVKNKLETRSMQEVFIQRTPPAKISQNLSASPFNYIERGYYEKYLKNFFDHFAENRIKVVILEKLADEDKEELFSLFKFLNIQPGKDYRKFLTGSINSNRIDYFNEELFPVLDELKRIYQPSVENLEDYLGRDLSVWKRELQ